MRYIATLAGLGLLFTMSACTPSRVSPDIAPSRAVGAAPSLDERQYYAPSEPTETVMPDEPRENRSPSRIGAVPGARASTLEVEYVPVEREQDGSPAKPLVPAFPAKMEQPRLRNLKTVYFLFDRADLTPEAKEILQANAAWLKTHPGARVRVEGHCDENGTSEYNLGLGSRRANQVRDYLIHLGVSPYMLEPVSFGEEMPLKAGHDEAAWRFNRRVQFSPIDAPSPTAAFTATGKDR